MFPAPSRPTAPMLVTSPRNPLVKDIRRAVASGGLTPDGYCVADGLHLIEEAVRSDRPIKAIVLAESVRAAIDRRFEQIGAQQIRVPDDLFAEIAPTDTPQGVVALVRPAAWDMAHVFRAKPFVLILDGIQEPGNAGAIVRTAEAFGVTGVLFLKGTVSPHNPKALRASAGSLFRVPVVAGVDEDLAIAAIAQRKMDLFAAMPDAEATLLDADLRRPCAFVIGNEGRGVSLRMHGAAVSLRIPTSRVESLNAAVAASIFVYEAWRQRHAGA